MSTIKTTLRKTYNIEDKQWIICTDFHSSMQYIEFNRENHPLIKNQGKYITLCKVPIHFGIKYNEDKDSKRSNRYPRNGHN